MATKKGPVLVKPIPKLETAAGVPFGPIDLTEYIKPPAGNSSPIKFFCEDAAATENSNPPAGLICTQDGLFGGIPQEDTVGNYALVIIAENDSDEPLVVSFSLSIKNPLVEESVATIKPQVWDALGKDLPHPSLEAALQRPITAVEIYYLMERWATLTIWDATNQAAPQEKKLLTLPNASPHFNIYDCGSCIIGAPKDLFSAQRTLEDALQTARVMAVEAHKRFHTVELSGFNKMLKAAFVEMSVLSNTSGKQLNIQHYIPQQRELDLIQNKLLVIRPSI